MRYSPKHTMVEPTASALNCCPPTANVIGEVLMVAFSGTRHSVFPVPLVNGDEVAARVSVTGQHGPVPGPYR